MNNTYSLQQTSQTGNLDSQFKTRQYKLDLMAWFMEIKFINPSLRQDQIAKNLVVQVVPCNDIDKIYVSFQHIDFHQTITKENKRFQIVNMISKDTEWLRMTSKDLNSPQMILKLNLWNSNWKEWQILKLTINI